MGDVQNMQWSPEEYQAAAFLAAEAGEEMLSRLELMVIQPAVILDVGCGAGELATALAVRYPAAKIIAVDTAQVMLDAWQPAAGIECRLEEAANLTLPDHSVDLLCANFLLPWVNDWAACLKEWRRVLKPEGVLMVSTLGIGTLQPLQQMLSPGLLPQLLDVHDLGDAMVTAGFADPVLDVARVPVRYKDHERLQQELYASGLLLSAVSLPEIELNVQFEVIHAHAFAPQPSSGFKADEDGVVRVPLSYLRRGRSAVG